MVNDLPAAIQDTCYQVTEDIDNNFDIVDNQESANAAVAEPDISQRPKAFPFDPFSLLPIKNGQLLCLNCWMT
jgi:hypothetical protein